MAIITTMTMATSSGCKDVDIAFRDAISCVRSGLTRAITPATTAVNAKTVNCRRLIGIGVLAVLLVRLRRSRVRWRCDSLDIGKGSYSGSLN